MVVRNYKPKQKPQKPRLNQNPNAPKVLVSANARFIVYREAMKNFPWKKLALTFILILLGGVGSAATQARIANTENDIASAEREYRAYMVQVAYLNGRIQESYSFVEVERLAMERLGMTFPDASQIINIYVPRMGGVTLNTADYALPQHNYFLHDLIDFFTGLINQMFGGGN